MAVAAVLAVGCGPHGELAEVDDGLVAEDAGSGDAASCPESLAATIDSANCPATCNDGAWLVTLAQAPSALGTQGLAVDAESIYWVEWGTQANGYTDGAVVKTSVDCGTVTVLASGQTAPNAIAIDATQAYWTNGGQPGDWGTGTVMSMPLGGGTPQTLASGQGFPVGIAVDETQVYWIDFSLSGGAGAGVLSAPKGGGPPATLASFAADAPMASGSPPSGFIAVDATSVYWVGDGQLLSVPKTGGGTVTLASVEDSASLVLDATTVYWTNVALGTVMSVPIAGGTPTTLASGQLLPFGIAVDPDNVYWTDLASNAVLTVPKGGGNATTLASGQSGYGMAVDATSLYWLSDSVLKLTPK